ncbi:MAG: substrate-binding domain-containing protein [Bryobacter sp.]|nr:substrate-binding domain-containing protein [Bryobacter sp.]
MAPYRRSQPSLATVEKACHILKRAAQGSGRWTLSQLAGECGIEKTAAFRLVHTLAEQGLLRRVDQRHYVSQVSWQGQDRLRLGFAQQGSRSSFSRSVTEGLRWAAQRRGIDLVLFDNAESGALAYRNAKRMVGAGVQVAVQFQVVQRMAARVAELYAEKEIPLIAVDIPHPGASYFGIDNYRAGQMAGEALCRWALRHWPDGPEELVLLEMTRAGSLPNSRLIAIEDTMRDRFGRGLRMTRLDTKGDFASGYEVVRAYLRRCPSRRTLLSSVTERALHGGVNAFEEAGRSAQLAALGIGGLEEIRREIGRPGSPIIGTVSAFPERYGDAILDLAFGAMQGLALPSATYAALAFLDAESLPHHYPLEC